MSVGSTLGNHEELLLDALRDISNLRRWLALGGTDTLRSYGCLGWPATIAGGLDSCRTVSFWLCRPYYETPTHLFVHGGYVPELAMDEQPSLALRWRVTDAATASPHCSGKVAVVGHTPQMSGEISTWAFDLH